MRRTRSVLVVDDSSDGREMLAEYLLFRGFDVTVARHGDEAVVTARQVRPTIVLMDLAMPGMDGWEATRQLRADAITAHSVIIALTAHAFRTQHDAAFAAGCDAVITKPYDLATLAVALERVVTKGTVAFRGMDVAVKPFLRMASPQNKET